MLFLLPWFLLPLNVASVHPGLPNVTSHHHTQPIDHFGYGAAVGSYEQRYFTYDHFLRDASSPTLVFFYCGNEDNVELYVNNTGLMWTLGSKMNALLVFAEHRYYGASLPLPPTTPDCLRFLTTEQATADYATLVRFLRLQYKDTDNAIQFIGFGGSYGGMLGAWMRMRYPDALDGMLAASAPILSFQGLSPSYDPSTYDSIVTRDAGGPGSGAAPFCAKNVRLVWTEIMRLASTTNGRQLLSTQYKTCQPLATEEEAVSLINWLQFPLGYMAMGNYPFPSDYMTHGDGKPMVAWPMRKACSYLSNSNLTSEALMAGMRQFISVWYNRTGVNAPCLFNGPQRNASVVVRGGRIERARRPMTRLERDQMGTTGQRTPPTTVRVLGTINTAHKWFSPLHLVWVKICFTQHRLGTYQRLLRGVYNTTMWCAGLIGLMLGFLGPDWTTAGFPKLFSPMGILIHGVVVVC